MSPPNLKDAKQPGRPAVPWIFTRRAPSSGWPWQTCSRSPSTVKTRLMQSWKPFFCGFGKRGRVEQLALAKGAAALRIGVPC